MSFADRPAKVSSLNSKVEPAETVAKMLSLPLISLLRSPKAINCVSGNAGKLNGPLRLKAPHPLNDMGDIVVAVRESIPTFRIRMCPRIRLTEDASGMLSPLAPS